MKRRSLSPRALVAPRIGTLRQHEPRPLRLPAGYFQASRADDPPTITLVTPSYNQARFLARTVESVLAQQYPTLEYVIQDGASTDDSVEVIRRYARHLTAWRSEPDGGQADAINRGFSGTTGEIMGWLNSDDVLLPGALDHVAQVFAARPDVDVAYGDRLLIDEHDREIGAWVLPAHDDAVLCVTDYVPQETLFWRRAMWDRAGARIDPNFHYALDWELLLRFREHGARIVHLRRFLGAFRVHDEQKTVAAVDVGDVETALLRERTHGRPAAVEEFTETLRPYLAKHRAIDALHRASRFMPRKRRLVTFEFDTPPWLT